jgi:hypothetical protein
MFGFGLKPQIAASGYNAEFQKRMERLYYDVSLIRGPMIEADLDWRAPQERRAMVEGDL